MAKAVVLLFLLDSLPDFNNVINISKLRTLPGMIGGCDSTITEPVIQVIGKKLNLSKDSVEKLKDYKEQLHNIDHNHYSNPKIQELSPESLNNVGFQDNSIPESYEFSAEKSPNYIEHNYNNNYTKNGDVLKPIGELKNTTEFGGKADFPESAPFLAAIFETVGNVTAQTCGGVVLASNWVLTAAGCVNVLGPFYSNSSNETLDNYYSVVAGAKNPLKDGTVHQVSKIYLHPSLKFNKSMTERHLRSWFDSMMETGNDTAPRLALLRVEPGISGGMLQMTGNKMDWDGVHARIYGWVLKQNQTGFEMRATSTPAQYLSPAECKKTYGVVENNATLCLMVNETAPDNTRMSSGCPVIVLRHGRPALLAVALTDGSRPLLASPLSAHRHWLNKFTRDCGNISAINYN